MQRFFVHDAPHSPSADACGTGLRINVYQLGNTGRHIVRASWQTDADWVYNPLELWPEALHFPSLEAGAFELGDAHLDFLASEGIAGAVEAKAYKARNPNAAVPRPDHKVIHVLRSLRDKYQIGFKSFDISSEF
jgi:hypothetical protein